MERLPALPSVFFLAATGMGCSFILPPGGSVATSDRHCAPSLSRSVEFLESPDQQERAGDASDTSLSTRAIETARVMDILPLVSRLAALQQTGDTQSFSFFELRQALTDRLLLTVFEVSSAVAEIVCERDRADQVADRMEEIDAARVKRLTLVSIVVSGVASIVSGGIGLAGGATTASDATEVSSGVLASMFGGTALFAASRQEFRHERNLLKEVWSNPKQSTVFSPTVWRFLQRGFRDQPSTARDEVINAWRQEGRLGERGSSDEQERIILFFGQGGTYSATELRARASMLETLEAHIQLLSEELEIFLREITRQRMQQAPQRGPQP
jgi:hypothetical protein